MACDLDALAATPVFSQLDDVRLRRVAARSAQHIITAGSVVAVRGEPADHLIVVESGSLTATYETVDGRKVRFGEFRAPCAVDKMAVLDAQGHTATWLASTRVRVRLVPSGELFTLLDDVPALRRHVLLRLSQQLREHRDSLVSSWVGDAATRIARWLCQAGGVSGTRVILPGAQQGLAETIGVTRVSVNRALRTLAGEGLIRIEVGAVVILAPELLAHRARTDQPIDWSPG